MKKLLIIGVFFSLILSSCSSSRTVVNSTKKTSSKADKVVRNALKYKGVKYKFGGTTRRGMDCSGVVYVAFGEAQGKMNNTLMDVHGAGCQRSDPKSGNAGEYPQFFGPQGDVRYVYNYVRCVRNIEE